MLQQFSSFEGCFLWLQLHDIKSWRIIDFGKLAATWNESLLTFQLLFSSSVVLTRFMIAELVFFLSAQVMYAGFSPTSERNETRRGVFSIQSELLSEVFISYLFSPFFSCQQEGNFAFSLSLLLIASFSCMCDSTNYKYGAILPNYSRKHKHWKCWNSFLLKIVRALKTIYL